MQQGSTDRMVDVWPSGCRSPNSCNRNGTCMYMKCVHANKEIKGALMKRNHYEPQKFKSSWNLHDVHMTEVVVDYTMTPVIPAQTYGPAENCYPEEGGEVELISVITVDTKEDIKLSEMEERLLIDELRQNTEFGDD